MRISDWSSDVCSSDLAEMTLWRAGSEQTVEVVTGEQPAPEQMAEASGPSRDSSYHSSELNAQLATLTPELRKRYGIPGEGEGVLVLDIKEGSVFEQGLRPGDVIRKVEGNAVESPQQVERLVDAAKSASKSAVLLLVSRRGQDLFLGVKLSDA